MDVEGEVALALQNMKEHFTWQSPQIPSPLLTRCQNIDTRGECKLYFTPMYKTLCPFELLILLERGLLWALGYPQVFFTLLQW